MNNTSDLKSCLALADRETLLQAMDHVSTTAEGDQKHAALTSLAQEASNETLKIATIQASGRGDEDTLKAISEVVDNRASQINQQELQHEIENPTLERSRSRRM